MWIIAIKKNRIYFKYISGQYKGMESMDILTTSLFDSIRMAIKIVLGVAFR